VCVSDKRTTKTTTTTEKCSPVKECKETGKKCDKVKKKNGPTNKQRTITKTHKSLLEKV
jgi:hypothetical protein